MSKKIYFISGLGADKRVFSKLAFPTNYELIYLDWIPPMVREPLESYAKRLSLGIDTSAPFYLVGLSFGGKQLSPIHTFIISSVMIYSHIPWYYRLAGSLRLHQIISVGFAKRANTVMYRLFGLRTRAEKAVFDQIIADTNPVFLKWALGSILDWRNMVKPMGITHIHGSADKILPVKYTKPDVMIYGAGHFMVYTHAGEIGNLIIEWQINTRVK